MPDKLYQVEVAVYRGRPYGSILAAADAGTAAETAEAAGQGRIREVDAAGNYVPEAWTLGAADAKRARANLGFADRAADAPLSYGEALAAWHAGGQQGAPPSEAGAAPAPAPAAPAAPAPTTAPLAALPDAVKTALVAALQGPPAAAVEPPAAASTAGTSAAPSVNPPVPGPESGG